MAPRSSCSALRKAVQSVVGAKLFMQIPQSIRVGGRLARTEYQYTLTDSEQRGT